MLIAMVVAGGLGVWFFGVCEGAFRALPPDLRNSATLGSVLATVAAAVGLWFLIPVENGAGGLGAAAVAIAAASLMRIVMGDRVGRALGSERPKVWVSRLGPVAAGWGRIVRPVADLASANPRVRAVETSDSDETWMEDDVEAGSARLFPLGSTTVREIMTPRPDVVAVESDQSWSAVIEVIRSSGRSRLPVFDSDLDTIVGVVYVKDLMALVHGKSPPPTALREVWRVPVFVPEAKPIDALLREFQRDRNHFAVVVDEYGGTAGVVTLEDIVEEVVGEIRDEHDRETPLVEWIGEERYRLDGRLDVDDFNDLTGSRLDPSQVETMAGLVAGELGRIAEGGESVEVGGWRFLVADTEGKRITKIDAVRVATSGETAADDRGDVS